MSAISYAELLTGASLGHHDEATVRGFFADLVITGDARWADVLAGRQVELLRPA